MVLKKDDQPWSKQFIYGGGASVRPTLYRMDAANFSSFISRAFLWCDQRDRNHGLMTGRKNRSIKLFHVDVALCLSLFQSASLFFSVSFSRSEAHDIAGGGGGGKGGGVHFM